MLQTIYEVNIGSWFNMGWWRWSFCLIRQRMRFIESVNDRSAIENFPAMQILWLEREKEAAASQVHSKFDLDLPSYWTSVQKWNYRSKDFGTENCTRYEKFNEADPPSLAIAKIFCRRLIGFLMRRVQHIYYYLSMTSALSLYEKYFQYLTDVSCVRRTSY